MDNSHEKYKGFCCLLKQNFAFTKNHLVGTVKIHKIENAKELREGELKDIYFSKGVLYQSS